MTRPTLRKWPFWTFPSFLINNHRFLSFLFSPWNANVEVWETSRIADYYCVNRFVFLRSHEISINKKNNRVNPMRASSCRTWQKKERKERPVLADNNKKWSIMAVDSRCDSFLFSSFSSNKSYFLRRPFPAKHPRWLRPSARAGHMKMLFFSSTSFFFFVFLWRWKKMKKKREPVVSPISNIRPWWNADWIGVPQQREQFFFTAIVMQSAL